MPDNKLTQNIIICLDDDGLYCQATRKRFDKFEDADTYSGSIAPSRKSVIVQVPYVNIDDNLYPIKPLT